MAVRCRMEELEAQMRAQMEAAQAAQAQAAAVGAAALAGVEDAAKLSEATAGQAVAEIDPADPATWGKVGRNAPCPCGSGKKYKHCHGRMA